MTQLQHSGRIVAAMTMAAALAFVPTAAFAQATSNSSNAEDADVVEANSVAATIDLVAPEAALASPGVLVGEEIVATAGGVETATPLTAGDGVAVTVGDGADVRSVTIDLPDEFDASVAAPAEDGTVVYPADDRSDEAVAVQTLDDGSTRIQTVIASPASQHEFEYSMDGYLPYQSESGETIFLNDEGHFVSVAAPWAVDANGVTVETSYEIRGGDLIQVVVPSSTTVYPVVADPTWMWNGPAWGMKLNRTETSRVRDYAQAGSMCVAFSKGAPGFAIACGAFAGYMATQAALAQSDNPKSCLFFTAAPIPGVIWRVRC